MATYADGDVLMMERTAALAITSSLTAVTIPTITGSQNGALVRPLYLEIAEATANFSMRVNNGSTTGTTQAIVAADLSVVNRVLVPVTDDTEILFSTATTATLDVRWIYPVGAKKGRVASLPHASMLPVISFSISVTDTAANLTVPSDAVEMVINGSAGGGSSPGVTYAVAATGTPTPIVNVPATTISSGAPYRLFIDEEDILRMVRLGDTNQTITGYWRLAA